MTRNAAPSFEDRLAAVDAKIAAHPFESERNKQARMVVESYDEKDKDAIERELRGRGLPGLAEQGKLVVPNLVSWWWLHRRRNKLLKQLARR
jgi:hypothetical protein